MSRTTEPPGIAIDLSIAAPAWKRALPTVASVARKAAVAALAQCGKKIGAAELSLVLADDATVQALNARWRRKDAPTNVLAFASDEPPAKGQPVLLGDVVLAYQTVAREAKEQNKHLADHLRHLVIHGVLHLLGHDHIKPAPAQRMEALERRILASLGVSDPYRLPANRIVEGAGRG